MNPQAQLPDFVVVFLDLYGISFLLGFCGNRIWIISYGLGEHVPHVPHVACLSLLHELPGVFIMRVGAF